MSSVSSQRDPASSTGEVFLSLVIPVYNEEENVEPLHAALVEALTPLGKVYEIIFIDDGSTDQSWSRLVEIARTDQAVKVIRFRRNFGQTAAFAAGFDHAKGQVIITMDADLQNDPRDIPKLLAKLDEGYDLVSGWRKNRKDVFLTRVLPSVVANRLIGRVTGVRLHDYGCALKAYRREVAKNLKLYGDMHRFIPAVASGMGIRLAELPVTHHPRRRGKSKYGLSRIFKVIPDLLMVKFLLDYSVKPMRAIGLPGLALFAAGLALALGVGVARLFFGLATDSAWLLAALLLMVSGMQLIAMGLLSELMVRTYYETQKKTPYVIKDIYPGEGEEPRHSAT